MGTNKLLLELDGESVIRGVARRALAGGLSPLVVVLGADAFRMSEELSGFACRIVVNESYEQGITSSMRAGVSSLDPHVAAAMILLADMPRVSSDMISAMVARCRETDRPLVISDYEGVNAPPIVYRCALFQELMQLTVEGCGKQVVKRHRDEAEVMHWQASALEDLDVPADYARMTSAH